MSELLDEQVKVAKKLMSELNITKSLIDGVMEKPAEFVRDFFSDAWGRPELALKMDEIRKRFGCLIYYVTHEESNFGEMYSFLIVSKYPEDWKYQFVKNTRTEQCLWMLTFGMLQMIGDRKWGESLLKMNKGSWIVLVKGDKNGKLDFILCNCGACCYSFDVGDLYIGICNVATFENNEAGIR